MRLEDGSKTLKQYNVDNSTVLEMTDRGAQFSYRGVFVVEYAGPIAIALLWAMRLPQLGFPESAGVLHVKDGLTESNFNAPEGSRGWNQFVQTLALCMWIAHFLKRELETFYVHKFSRPTMPLTNLFKNSAYYWGFAAAVGYPLVHPDFTAPGKQQVALGVALWVVCQLVNFAVHVQLSNMRPKEGSTDRNPPTGFLFSLVSCPNYTAEVLGWVAFSITTQIALAYVFTVVGLLQMTQWALDKHRGYRKNEEYKKLRTKAIIPFII